MTLIEIAEEHISVGYHYYDGYYIYLHDGEKIGPYPYKDEAERTAALIVDTIAVAVRDAYEDAYERAAIVIDGLAAKAHTDHQRFISEGDVNEALGYGYEQAAAAIRALKEPST